MGKFLLVIFLIFTSIEAQSKEKSPLKGKGVLFFSTANMWDYAGVDIDGESAGRVVNGMSAIILDPGVHQLTGLYSGSTRSASLSVVFEIKPESVTSLGTLVFIKEGTKSYFLKLKNDRAANVYLQRNMPDIYKSNLNEISYPEDTYVNAELDKIQKFILEKARTLNNSKDFIASDLGVLVDLRGEARKVDTGVLEKISVIPAEDINFKRRYFLTSLGELYREGDGSFVAVNQPGNFDARGGFQAGNWIALENYYGDLSFSKDDGATWTYIDTPISKEFTNTILQPVNKYVIFGPVTGISSNQYDKLLGYLIDIETGGMKKIEWNKYVFKDSRFYFVAGKLVMDPVVLGGKAFLFSYDDKKDSWNEIRLPNRRCKIEADEVKIKLNCSSGSSYYSDDVGLTWNTI